jgi:hypothetical protein
VVDSVQSEYARLDMVCELIDSRCISGVDETAQSTGKGMQQPQEMRRKRAMCLVTCTRSRSCSCGTGCGSGASLRAMPAETTALAAGTRRSCMSSRVDEGVGAGVMSVGVARRPRLAAEDAPQ